MVAGKKRGPDQGEPGEVQTGAHGCRSGADGGSGHTEVQLEDEKPVEDYIQGTHEDLQHPRKPGIARGLEHLHGPFVEHEKGQEQAPPAKVGRGHGLDGRFTMEPDGQVGGRKQSGHGECEGKEQDRSQTLAADSGGEFLLSGADGLRGLDGKPEDDAPADAGKQPGAGGDQANGGGGKGSQAAGHGGIDELHQGPGDLGENGGHGQAENQAVLPPGGKGHALAQVLQGTLCGVHEDMETETGMAFKSSRT